MAEFTPFRGVRFRQDLDLNLISAQPYDKISPQMLKRYLSAHPNNIVRITKNSNYQEAAQLLESWLRDGTLVMESRPALYPYQQEFEVEGRLIKRLGFLGLASLTDSQARGHERVMAKPLEDRLRLFRSIEANAEPIFMLYSDPGLTIEEQLGALVASAQPIAEVGDEYGAQHRLWCLDDPATLAWISANLTDSVFYIADGHHRYFTSLSYQKECLAQGWEPAATESFDKRLVALFNMEAEGLQILPTHRGVRNLSGFELETFLASLEEYFEVKSVDPSRSIWSILAGHSQRFGLMASEHQRFIVSLRPGALESSSFMPELKGPSRNLDVNLLHNGILEPGLGIGPEELSSGGFVSYHRDREELAAQVRSGHTQLGFFLNPTTLGQVKEISDLGERMPQKSTDFFPKLLSGLVLMKMQINKRAGHPVSG